MENLFRQQAIDEKRGSFLGTVHLSVSPPMRWMVAICVLVCVLLCLFLTFGEYTRREQAFGVLLPAAGLIEITATGSGVVTDVYPKQGDTVAANAALVTISSEKMSSAVGATAGEIIAQLRAQKTKLSSDVEDLNIIQEKQASALRSHIDALKSQIKQIDEQLILLRRQIALNTELLSKIRPLETKGYISSLQIQQQESSLLDQQVQLKSTTRERLDAAQQLNSQLEQLGQLPLTTQAQRHDLERKIADIEQSLAQNEAQRSVILTSPQSGVIASSLVTTGQAVKAGQTIMVITPVGSQLIARLLLPTKSIGFIKEGDKVVLRYQAYPYQKFGLHEGRVADIARSPLPPAQASTLVGQQLQEPMYTVDVDISEQEIEVYGAKQALKPGMEIDADIMLEHRSLIEWIFDPLYSIEKRLSEKREG